MRFVSLFRYFPALLIVPVLLFWSLGAQAAGQARVIAGSRRLGSMWGQIEGISKIVIARRAIKDLLSRWDRNIQLGLSAYGHRRKGDCSDIQTIYPVGPARPDAIMSVVNALKPKGKTPLSEAVRRAAQELKFTEDRATVILVSDGKETCQADPCALGRELEEPGVDFTVHVVGFDVAKQQREGLQCLAENTGGLFLSARNASELNSALAKAVTALKREPKKVAAKPAPRPEKAVEPGHGFSAILSEGDDPITRGMRWDIYEAKQKPDGKRKQIKGTYNAQPKFVLDAGKYLVVAKYGNATVSQEFDVASAGEAKKHVLILNAGLLALNATLAEGGEIIERGMRWDVYQLEKDAGGKRRHVKGNYDRTPQYKLPAGDYFIVARTGNATISGKVKIISGERTERTFVMNAGIAVFSASYSEGGKAISKGMRWDVYGLEKDLDGKRKHINGNYAGQPKFRLPAGHYYVVTKRGDAIVSGEIEVTAGKRTDTPFVLDAGLLALSATLTSGKAPLKKGLRWDVYSADKDIEGKRKHFAGNYGSAPIFTLNAGAYLIVLKRKQAKTEQPLTVKPGDSRRIDVTLE